MSIFQEAFKLHQAGRVAEAQIQYRQILALDPQHPHALHMMATVEAAAKRFEAAETFIQKAIAARPDLPGQYETLGNILRTQNRHEDAIKAYRKALDLKPDFTGVLNCVGACLLALRRRDEALASFKKVLTIDPGHTGALNNIGVILQDQTKYEGAIEYYKKALIVNPQDSIALVNSGLALMLMDRLEESQACYEKAIQYKPGHSDAHLNLGHVLRRQGKFEESIRSYKNVLALRPDPEAHAKLGIIYQYGGQFQKAVEEYEKALALKPDFTEVLNNVGALYHDLEHYEEALRCYQKVLATEPDEYRTYGNIAGTLKNLGRLDDAIAYQRKAISLAPGEFSAYTNLLLTMVYASSVTPEALTDTAREFGRNIADPLIRQRPFKNVKDSERKLRIGYISGDFWDHAVHYFFEPLLLLHDRRQFEVFAYSNTAREDEVTERLKKEFDHWNDIRFMKDDDAADLIERQQIDILVDMSGHTAGHKLLVMARKPAPVQITWLGYPATTGMKAIDYKISDFYTEPPGMTEHLNVEKLYRLPDIFCCYQGHRSNPAVIDHPPFEDNDYITFGCFNNFSKVTDPVLQAWSEIMKQVPNSRLLLEIKGIEGAKFRADTEERLNRFGIPLDRVIIEARKRANQFVLYNRIDMALDPFPCAGGTTSMDTLWMGVPFVTLEGRHFVSRMGVSILTNAGLPDLIARSVDEYIEKAVSLANNRPRLKELRDRLRDKFAASPVMDQARFARNMEAAYRDMWRKWCAS